MKRAYAVPAAVTWMGLIFLASSLPGSATGPNTPLWVFVLKTLHFVNFGVLAVLFFAVLKGSRSAAQTGLPVFVLGLLLTVMYAVSDEYHQKFSEGRSPSAKDVLIDTTGAAVFLGVSFVLSRRYGNIKNQSGAKKKNDFPVREARNHLEASDSYREASSGNERDDAKAVTTG